MKKIFAIVIVAALALSLCIGASARLNIDRIFVNANTLAEGTDVKDGAQIEINGGDKLYILGWAFGEESNLKEIVYSLDDGDDVACPDNYRDRTDVAGVLGVEADLCLHGGFGHDTAEEGGMLELPGVGKKGGTYVLHITAIYNDGTRESNDYTLVVSGDAAEGADDTKAEDPGATTGAEQNPATADASVIAIAAVACIALAGVVVAKKVK